MKTIALLAQKGGTGKTTLALALAVAAQSSGRLAVIVDLDPQATACRWSDRREATAPVVVDAQPARLDQALQRAREEGVALALIDTPARSEQAALAAARAADLVLIPVRPQIYDLETLPMSRELVLLAGAPEVAVVLNAVPPRGMRHEQARAAIRSYGLAVLDHALTQRAAFGDSAALGLTVEEYEPAGKAADEVRQVYRSLWPLLSKTTDRKAHEKKARPLERAG